MHRLFGKPLLVLISSNLYFEVMVYFLLGTIVDLIFGTILEHNNEKCFNGKLERLKEK